MTNNFLHDCKTCKNPCDGKSKNVYTFTTDVEFSEHFEEKLVQAINNKGFYSKKTDKDGYPDVEIYNPNTQNLLCYIELKAQRRTFMSVKKILPNANLEPSETMVLNLSDLLRYAEIAKTITQPIYIMWILTDRPCIVNTNKVRCFYQSLEKLCALYEKYKDLRRFRRKSGEGDIVDGVHKGVVVNYHFSLNELIEFNTDDFLKEYR